MLTAFHVPARVAALADLHERGDDGRRLAGAVLEAFGVAVVPGLVALLDDRTWHAKASAVVSLMCENAKLLAPALVRQLRRGNVSPTRAIMKVLGYAGPGHEAVIAEQLEHADEQVSFEALRALARIGSRQAAALVARQLQGASARRRAAAEEALWHFPAARAAVEVRQLLGRRDFVVQHPNIAASLLAHAAAARTQGLEDVLAKLEPLRFRFWNRGLMRVARKARELRAQ
jgi:HEAT repeat protein